MIAPYLFGRKLILVLLFVSTSILSPNVLFANNSTKAGEEIFKQTCSACHTIGKGSLVGPDLANISKKRSEMWITGFVKSSQSMIKSGDPEALEIFEKFNKMPMPDHALSDDDIKSVISYIAITSGDTSVIEAGTVESKESEESEESKESEFLFSEKDVELGRSIFQGHVVLANRGPACNSCHNVNDSEVLGGGSLAADLTTVLSRMNFAGAKAIMQNPPFPVMKQAYSGSPLTEKEIHALASFLSNANENSSQLGSVNYGLKLFVGGVVGVIFLLICYSVIFSNRRRRAVNQNIYDRQIKSE